VEPKFNDANRRQSKMYNIYKEVIANSNVWTFNDTNRRQSKRYNIYKRDECKL